MTKNQHASSLRESLQSVTEKFKVVDHAAQIELIRQNYHHTIQPISKVADGLKYNCVMSALGIQDDSRYVSMAMRCPHDVHANSNFVHFLVERGLLVEQAVPKAGLIVAYLDEGRFRHVGKLVSHHRAQSKWGIGLLYEHGLLEVPISYGDSLKYFLPMGRDQVIDAFCTFAIHKGIALDCPR